ncbi:hypothetical protein JZ751_013472 [Albula glossodonta]|uniref:Uncharacterized protein n=1 Tax=Albula glossodonta TaxID=121402 RepID=A0A8T2N5N8_9TELE|nr:hypothetical protein JZ751_013472 [Albula glossodonta]
MEIVAEGGKGKQDALAQAGSTRCACPPLWHLALVEEVQAFWDVLEAAHHISPGGREAHQGKDPQHCQGLHPRQRAQPDLSMDPQRSRLPSPEQSCLPPPERSRLPSPERSRLPLPERSRLPSPERSRLPSPERSRLPSRPNLKSQSQRVRVRDSQSISDRVRIRGRVRDRESKLESQRVRESGAESQTQKQRVRESGAESQTQKQRVRESKAESQRVRSRESESQGQRVRHRSRESENQRQRVRESGAESQTQKQKQRVRESETESQRQTYCHGCSPEMVPRLSHSRKAICSIASALAQLRPHPTPGHPHPTHTQFQLSTWSATTSEGVLATGSGAVSWQQCRACSVHASEHEDNPAGQTSTRRPSSATCTCTSVHCCLEITAHTLLLLRAFWLD